MSRAIVSRWARRYVLASVLFLLAWQAGTLFGIARGAEVLLGVYGFVLHMVFGKAYSLVPSYFDRELAFPYAPAVQFPVIVGGTLGLVGDAMGLAPSWLGAAGAALWALGVAVFLGSLLWTIRGNLIGRETATGSTNADREPIDRLGNGFVPVALGYLLVGTYGTLALQTGLPPLVDGYGPRVTHLLAAGTAALLVFALGVRLLPRFLVASPPRWLVTVVLPAGAVGPTLLAVHLGSGVWFRVGAAVEAVAVTGFALIVASLYLESDRRRVGFYGVLAGATAGVLGVALGLWFAFGGVSGALIRAHLRLNLLGFLGLTIVGLAYQFYPPTVGQWPGSSDRAALVSIGALGAGLLVQVGGLAGGEILMTKLGQAMTLAGALMYAYLLGAAFGAR